MVQIRQFTEAAMQTLNQDIKDKTFKRVYLLFGDEPFLVNSYKKRLREAITGDDTMNYNYFEGKGPDVKEIISLADTMPFFAERRLVLIDGSGFFKSSAPEELVDYIAEIPESTCMVFVESEVDKRNKLYKKVKDNGYAAELKKQDADQLMRWAAGILAKDGKKITRQIMEYFMERTGDDMENIRMELEKLICYCLDRDVVTAEDVEAVCTTRITNHIFDMVNAIAEKQPQKALQLYYDLLALKEPPMRVLFLIARQCNLLLQTKELKNRGHDNKTIASKIGVPPFAAGKYVAQASHFKTSVLKNAVKQCVETEEAVKSGRMNDMMSVEILILSVLPS